MNRKRILALGKLGLLFGGPLALIVGLFSCGVYCGYDHRTGIAGFERDWLGMDVEVPGSDDDKAKGDKAKDDDDRDKDKDKDKDKDRDSDRDKDDDRDKAKDKDRDRDSDRDRDGDRDRDSDRDSDRDKDDRRDSDRTHADSDRDRNPTPPPPEPEPLPTKDPEPGVKVDALPPDLAARLAMPVTLRVKVLVDDELIARRKDWIDYVQLTVEQASYIYQQQFGITLQLSSVGRWPVATLGMDSTQLLDDLRSRPREQAELLIGLTDRPQDDHVSGKADTPIDDNPYNGAYAVVYAKADSSRPHLRTLLHEIGHTLGAKDVIDRSSPEWQSRSWMSYAPASATEDAWIDERNRARILERKDLPFAPEPPPMPEPEPAPAPEGGEPE